MESRFEVHDRVDTSEKDRLFLEEHGTVFHDPSFLTSVGRDFRYVVVADRETGEIAGALPLVKSRKFGMFSYHIPPFGYRFGPVVSSAFASNKEEIIDCLLRVVQRESHVDFNLSLSDEDIIPYKTHGFSILASQTHQVEKATSYNLNSVHVSKRRYLKKLINLLESGQILVNNGADCLSDLLAIYRQNANMVGFASHDKELEALFHNLSERRYYAHVLYSKNGEPLAGAFCPYDRHFAYHLINASVSHGDKMLARANILSTYLAVEKGLNLGIGFDFEGSNLPGVASFYRMMGGEPRIVFRLQKTKSLYYHLLRALKTIRAEAF